MSRSTLRVINEHSEAFSTQRRQVSQLFEQSLNIACEAACMASHMPHEGHCKCRR